MLYLSRLPARPARINSFTLQYNSDMLSLIFIRHGETDWNSAQRIQGQADIPLNANGVAQAQTLIPVMKMLFEETPFPIHIYASPLKRAFQTAQIAVDGGAPITPDDELMEIDYGRWSGCDGPGLERDFPQECHRWFSSQDPEYCPHGGESRADLERRAARFHARVIAPHMDSDNLRILLFSHGGLIAAYLNHLLSAKARFSTDNAALTEVVLLPNRLPYLYHFNAPAGVGFRPFSLG